MAHSGHRAELHECPVEWEAVRVVNYMSSYYPYRKTGAYLASEHVAHHRYKELSPSPRKRVSQFEECRISGDALRSNAQHSTLNMYHGVPHHTL